MDKISILDAGGQYVHLIARKVRELGVYSEILPIDSSLDTLKQSKGLILSGGPSSVLDEGSPTVDPKMFDLGVPVLGICYGHQLMARLMGGDVQPGNHREYGTATLNVYHPHGVLRGLEDHEPIWMSHGDQVLCPPPGFRIMAGTANCKVAAMEDGVRLLFSVQFHPEVSHTRKGNTILSNFVLGACGCEKNWSVRDRIPQLEEQLRRTVGKRRVFFFVSGGVDSTVAYTLAVRALPPGQIHGAYIDTGFMRKNESAEIGAALRGLGHDIEIIDAGHRFRETLAGIVDPEEKRRRIGEMFIRLQDEAITRLGWKEEWVLGQGTIYPDTIESGGAAGGAGATAKIKTHHNRVGKVAEMIAAGRVVEPIAELYKDEVREVGRGLALPAALIERHPFPGPGLAIRCLCSAEESPATEVPGQKALLLPLRSVGVQGDFRTYSHPTMLWAEGLTHEQLAQASVAITNTSRDSNRVTYLLGCRVPENKRRWHSRKATLTEERIRTLQEADARVRGWLEEEKLTGAVWQFPVVLVPLAADEGETIVLRPVESVDGMTARYAPLDFAALSRLTPRLLELTAIEAVLLDISNKPPATIEWE